MKKLSNFKECGEVKTTVTGKLLFYILNELANNSNEIIIPQRKISETLKIAKGTVGRNLCRLRDGGYIVIVPRYHGDGGRAANKYIIK